MYLTKEMLIEKKACQDQVNLFAATFPDGVPVTEAACLAVAGLFDWAWAAMNLLPKEHWAEYKDQRAPIDAEYLAKRRTIWADYKDQRAPIDAEYLAKHAPILAEYEANLATIWAECEAKRAPILAEYEAKHAALFGRIAETV